MKRVSQLIWQRIDLPDAWMTNKYLEEVRERVLKDGDQVNVGC